jgi:hypothetical protein
VLFILPLPNSRMLRTFPCVLKRAATSNRLSNGYPLVLLILIIY